LPTSEVVRRATEGLVPVETGQHLLRTNRGTYIVAVGSAHDGAFDDRFVLVSSNGALVDDQDLLRLVNEGVPVLQELRPLRSSAVAAVVLEAIPQRDVPYGLITAADWLDYRRPAGAPFFIGRESAMGKAVEIVGEASAGVILEVKSRSGVGKSSLLSVLEGTWTAKDYRVELHDARDVQSSDDVLRLVSRFVGGTPIRSFEGIPSALSGLSGYPGSVFLVDQFESTFQSSEVFSAYEYVALCIARTRSRCAMVFSRKDDLLTTHDDLVIKLDRLRGMAQSITLDDFSLEEASALIDKIAESSPRKIALKVLTQVLEFAQGFPWLLKRTMAHIAATMGKGTSQQELLSSGLHLGDLFEEELAELDEHERGYLTRIAAVLPATYQVIARRFEDDPFLPQMLETLTTRRLLRLSAGTYDTYNDVFKDFLLYERLPERSHAQILRMGLIPVMQAFRALGGVSSFDPAALSAEWAKPQTGVYNLLRDLRIAGLVAKTSQGWFVPDVVRQYEHQNRLGEFVRQSLLRNRLVSDLLVEIERRGSIPRRDVAAWLRGYSRFVKAKEAVWSVYANILVDWVIRLRLADHTTDDCLVPSRADRSAIHVSLGNLAFPGRGPRPSETPFIPQISLSTATRVLRKANAGRVPRTALRRLERAARDDLGRLGAVMIEKDGSATALMTEQQFDAVVKDLLNTEPYQKFWKLLLDGTRWDVAIEQAFALSRLAKATRHGLGLKLANWGRAYGHLPRRLSCAKRRDSRELELTL
jgi:hypothetical protein